MDLKTKNFEPIMESLETKGFNWDCYRDIFPFADLSLLEGEYVAILKKVLDLLPDNEQKELLLDLQDTQFCVYLEQVWIQNEQHEKKGSRGPFAGEIHFISARLQLHSNLRDEYGLQYKNARDMMKGIGPDELLLDRMMQNYLKFLGNQF